jgi:hypothetical protein
MNKVIACEHVCSGDCRRVGCDCGCGEFHQEATALKVQHLPSDYPTDAPSVDELLNHLGKQSDITSMTEAFFGLRRARFLKLHKRKSTKVTAPLRITQTLKRVCCELTLACFSNGYHKMKLPKCQNSKCRKRVKEVMRTFCSRDCFRKSDAARS